MVHNGSNTTSTVYLRFRTIALKSIDVGIYNNGVAAAAARELDLMTARIRVLNVN